MKSINPKSLFNTLKEYLEAYRENFYKRSFDNFVVIIVAILVLQEVRSIRFIYDKFIKKYFDKCLNSMYYFLADKNILSADITRCTINKALSMITEPDKNLVTIYLLIDDTLQTKFGTKFDCVDCLFDHADHSGNPYKNGHCFVSLAMSFPIEDKYITIPIGCKIYDKELGKNKLELAAELIEEAVPVLKEYQVIVECDAWYTKKTFLSCIMNFENVEFVGRVRIDTVLYDIKIPERTKKRGRPKKYGDRINYKNLPYQSSDNVLWSSTIECKTNLLEKKLYATYITNNTDTFDNIRLYLSTIESKTIHSYDKDGHYYKNKQNSCDDKDEQKETNIFEIYRMRWKIEVMFYQEKTFWSLGKYMVRSKTAIENYVNLVGVCYTLSSLLPFIYSDFKNYKFQSPQEVKYNLSEKLQNELFLYKLLKTLQFNKKYEAYAELQEYFNSEYAS